MSLVSKTHLPSYLAAWRSADLVALDVLQRRPGLHEEVVKLLDAEFGDTRLSGNDFPLDEIRLDSGFRLLYYVTRNIRNE